MNGVKINRKKALQLFNRVAGSGSAEALFHVGRSGHVFGRSYQLKHFRLAADLGHAKAEASLARNYEVSGPGQDLVEARRLYESAAAKGYPAAQACLNAPPFT
jgi:TPR repeat protein